MLTRIKICCYVVLNKRISIWIFDISLLVCLCWLACAWRRELLAYQARVQPEPARARGGALPALARAQLLRRLESLNMDRRVLNDERFAELLPSAPVLLVAARGRRGPLRRLLASLERVPDVAAALLVVSHTVYDNEVDQLVRGVRFCRVLQIFYPFSLQLYPARFPGPDPADCPGRAGAGAPCSPRDAAANEDKHHWWWTASFLFNHFLIENGYIGPVLFLQDDEYVLPDVLHMLRYAVRALAYHPEINVISLGQPRLREQRGDLLTLLPWRPPLDRGLAFNSSVWQRIEPMASRYCAYDDVSWSYSLLNVFAGLPAGRAEAVVSDAPRVLRAGGGGGGGGGGATFPARVYSAFLAARGGRAPERVRAPPRGAGGWTDARDHLLCLDGFIVIGAGRPTTTTTFNARTIG